MNHQYGLKTLFSEINKSFHLLIPKTTFLFQWNDELKDYEKTFLDQAAQVNAWDRLLMENGEKVGVTGC